ncbi:uncharacterized protein TNCV_1942601 [Trichonephila clavipes]|nr:uncharacterized protein TNCV_1942601 [Trichonephila clavipes]
MGRSDAAIRRCWRDWVDSGRFQRHDDSGRPRSTADWEERLIVKSAFTVPDLLLSTIRPAGPLWSSLETHLQQSGASMTFRELFCYLSFLLYLDLIFQQDNARPHTERVAMNCQLVKPSLTSQITRSLSNQAYLECEGKASAPTIGANLARTTT